MRKPVIGFCVTPARAGDRTGSIITGKSNAKFWEDAGFLSIIFPVDDANFSKNVESYLDLIDALYIPGGLDLNPKLFKEDMNVKVTVVNDRLDAAEIAMVKGAIKRGMPVFGICRGCQLINVALGGTLYQDLPTQYKDLISHYGGAGTAGDIIHTVTWKDGSKLGKAIGTKVLGVNSFHHQACKKMGKGLEVVATAPDGMIEAYEDAKRCIYGTQFHPECLNDYEEYHDTFTKFAQMFKKDADAYVSKKAKAKK